jgi:hypothetical protein
MFGYGQTKSSVANKIKVTLWTSSNGKKTYMDINPGRTMAVVYKSTLKDDGGVDEEQFEESLGLQLEKIRGLGQDGKELGQGGYGAHVTIVGVDGLVTCDRERVSKVLRKKKGGRCIYRIVVDHGNKVKTTHPGTHSGMLCLDERWELPG